ncbi:AraC family transcriptional regulator [Pseudoalteromonas luteoviolacea]|uniref:AraC family transcriptional regulator n=1 Tax=Pseudoalteromonas luteoviolacea TaxID=43657 RepID=UPI001B38F906|nr:AraC family transcriptional regulator [Pseudoalteromonas luteoviolacea]MBQ4838013.1 AraC family transcriptional regulator ligand-binding domain-containing protein [Pseudoalteromonas luteoviolacea]
MKIASKFTVHSNCKILLKDMDIDVETVVAYSKLPADILNRDSVMLSPKEYFDWWLAIEKAAEGRDVPLLVAEHLTVEVFDAPLFAALCSPDLNTALSRIQHYKPLIGPMKMDLDVNEKSTEMALSCYGYEGAVPTVLALTEMVFFTKLLRLATRHEVTPLAVILPELPNNLSAYETFFGCKPKLGSKLSLMFKAEDAVRPFLTANSGMWTYFEGGLKQKLADLTATATIVERVRAVLVESLPAGHSDIEFVAQKLTMSKRTLQRKLTEEQTTFHRVLQDVRLQLAKHYLSRSHVSLSEIAFLLGYQEANSFIRAFTTWCGVSPGSYREQLPI